MKIWKLIAGILSIVYSIWTMILSYGALENGLLQENSKLFGDGMVSLIVAAIVLIGGIVSLLVRDSNGKLGNIALIVIFGFAAMIGFACKGNDSVSLGCWSIVNVIAVVILMAMPIFSSKKEQ